MAEFAPRRILCPVDFSEYSAAALRWAGEFARSFGAEVRVLHAQRFDAPVYFTPGQVQTLRKQLRRTLWSARSFLEEFAGKHLPGDVRRSLRLVEREPVDAILRMRKEWGADLLVMSTHGRTGLTRLRLGSVLESVLRQITGPILTIGPAATAAPGPIRRILLAADLSLRSQAALSLSIDLASHTGAELTALHVVDGPVAAGRDAYSALCDWIPAEARNRCNLREVVREGKTSATIMAEAKKLKADLLVLGAHPRSYLGQLVFGSTTETVIRTAPCPVLSAVSPVRGGRNAQAA
jgi:nucleotide-binding universal stress UspA family protein